MARPPQPIRRHGVQETVDADHVGPIHPHVQRQVACGKQSNRLVGTMPVQPVDQPRGCGPIYAADQPGELPRLKAG